MPTEPHNMPKPFLKTVPWCVEFFSNYIFMCDFKTRVTQIFVDLLVMNTVMNFSGTSFLY